MLYQNYRGVEKWLTRQPHKLEIDGSNPSSATNTHRYQSGLMATPAKRVIRWFKSSPVLQDRGPLVELVDTLVLEASA